LNFEYYIAKRIYGKGEGVNRFSGPAVKVAIAGIALGLAVMIISVAVVTGFKNEIRQKVTGFGSHIRITNFDNNSSYESVPIRIDSAFVKSLLQIDGVKSVQQFATKPGIIRYDNSIQGVILKGLGSDFDSHFIKQHIVDGEMTMFGSGERNDSIMISLKLARMLGLNVGDKFNTFFFQDKIRARSFVVQGIFRTNFPDFDKMFVLVDMRHIRRLNDWDSTQVSGLELQVSDFDRLDEVNAQVFMKTANRFDDNGTSFLSRSIKELYPDIFGWLELVDMNVWIILVLMLLVASFNMISGVLILILERTNMIGLLKSLGTTNWSIRKIFVYNAAFLIARGMMWGNLIGILLCVIQLKWGILTLNPENYYIDVVPINLELLHIVALNVGSMAIIVLMMVLPSWVITRISPSKSIKFE
jgi:lipoprotein-releasing system permease protein